jgi:peptidoglycan/LPS O-acetylase OafA/YrhL
MRLDNLTGVRAFAAFAVVLFHFAGAKGIKGQLDLGQLVARGDWGVDLFFVLSGLILSHVHASEPWNPANRRLFLVKRFARIYPLHLATFGVTVAVWLVARSMAWQFGSNTDYSASSAVLNVLLLHAWGFGRALSWNGASWSVSAEWFAYLFLFPFCVTAAARITTARLATMVAVSWVALLVTAHLVFEARVINLTTWGFLRIIPEFLAGYLIFRGAGRFSVSGDWTVALGVALALMAAARDLDALMLPAIMALLFGLYRGGRLADAIFGNRVAVFLGEISYSVYLTHGFIKIASDQLVIRGLKISPIPLMAADIFAVIAVAWIAFAVIERPGRRWIVAAVVKRLVHGPNAQCDTCASTTSGLRP